MPSIDLARLRKQALRLADFFFAPEEFSRNLNAVLDTYVNYTIRARRPATSGAMLPAHRTPSVVMRHIEHELATLASAPEHAAATLALADQLWDEAWIETRQLAAFLLGCIPPEEGPLVARLTAWVSQVRDSAALDQLLEASLPRMRAEAPDMFLHLISEWLRPERSRLWPSAVRAAISAIKDRSFVDLPALMETLAPTMRGSPPEMQPDLEELILALFAASPTETAYFIRQILSNPVNLDTALLFRRMAPALPAEIQEDIRELVRGRPSSVT